MKKRMYVYLLIFSVCLFHLIIPDIVFGQSAIIFNRYEETFKHPDVHAFFPEVLIAFKDPDVQPFLNSTIMNRFVERPRYIWRFVEDADESIVVLLTLNEDFRTLFRDEQFHSIVRSDSEIDNLVRLIRRTTPTGPPDTTCDPPARPKATTLTIVPGHDRESSPGDLLPIVMEVRDQYGNVFSDVNVTFSVVKGGGSVLPATARPDSSGRARTTLTLGPNAGVNVVEAKVPDVSPEIFMAVAPAPAPTETVEPEPEPPELTRISGNNQRGAPNTPLNNPFVVLVSDADGNGVPHIGVRFSVLAGEGELSDETAITDEDGRAETTFTFGSSAESVLIGASIAGFGVTQVFTAIATGSVEPVVFDQLPPVYWVEGGALYYRPTGGEKSMLLEPRGATLTGGLAVDMVRERIYWTEQTKTRGRIRSANMEGGEVRKVELREKDGVPLGIAVDTEKGRVYWTTSVGKIQRIDVGDILKRKSNTESIKDVNIGKLNFPTHIAFDEKDDTLYWTEPGGIKRRGKGLIVRDLGELGGIAVANGVVYWTEKSGSESGKVKRVGGNGLNEKPIAVLASVPEGIAVDPVGNRLYWTTSLGEIQSVSLDREPVQVVNVDGNPVSIALGRASDNSMSAPMITSAPSTIGGAPQMNALLANYPNPFNPETWIPYQLSEAANVTVSIYSVNGSLIRTLALGHQAAGMYQSRNRAAYWDGRNEFGERVASGLYFYTLTAGDFTATRKMLIRK